MTVVCTGSDPPLSPPARRQMSHCNERPCGVHSWISPAGMFQWRRSPRIPFLRLAMLVTFSLLDVFRPIRGPARNLKLLFAKAFSKDFTNVRPMGPRAALRFACIVQPRRLGKIRVVEPRRRISLLGMGIFAPRGSILHHHLGLKHSSITGIYPNIFA